MTLEYFSKSIGYLEDHDFDKEGNLIAAEVPSDTPVVVMLQSSWCPQCREAKINFQEFANATQGRIFCATIQADGERSSEKSLGDRIKSLKPNFRGFPDYLLYVNGLRIDREVTGRDVKHLRDFSTI